jgi:DNA-binding transcriptional regulator YiaG
MSFKELRTSTGMNIKEFSEYFNIPYRTMQNWESERRQCPEYLLELMHYKLVHENKIINYIN